MQKVLNILEQHVQWIAIGLGALFALFMVYTYVLQPPAKVVIGSDTLTAGDVDPYILEHDAKPLESQFHGSGKLDVKAPKYVQGFEQTMTWAGAKPIELAGGFPVLPPLPDATTTSDGTPTTNANGVPTDVALEKVKTLPVPPPPTPAEAKFGRSVIVPAVAGVAGGQPPPTPQPGQPGAAGVDKDWVTQLFHVKIKDIENAFVAAKVPPKFNSTMFLQVEMQRVEVDPKGAVVPGSEQIIPPLDVWRSNVAPPPYPGEAARDQQGPYLQWAAANTADIIEPLFYTVLKGDQWNKPGAQATEQVQFDPQQYLTGAIPTWATPDQRIAIFKARQEAYKAAEDAKKAAHPARSAPAASPGGAAGGGGFAPYYPPHYLPPNFAPPAPKPAAHPQPAHPAARPPVRNGPPDIVPGVAGPSMEGGPLGFNPAGGPMPGYGNPGATAANLPQPGTDFPVGPFDPADPKWAATTIDGWCHDQTVVPGKTYRYRIRYKLKNPVLGAGNVTDPPQLSNVFAIVSEWSVWSSDVNIPPLVNFFVAGNRFNGGPVAFDVYKWENGQQRSESFRVNEGDEVGGVDKSGSDFTTGWTVVDFRIDSRSNETQVLLVNDKTGQMVTRSFAADQSDPLYKGLKEQVQAAKALETATAGAPGAPGGAPGGGAPAIH